MATLDKKIISSLYNGCGLSTSEIAIKYNVSKWSVVSFMRRNGIERRKPSETRKIQFERQTLTYQKKARLNFADKLLLVSGLSLYWAEGSKANKFTVDFANSDEKMLCLFIKMLRQIYGITESKLRIYLYCYSNQKPDRLVDFWAQKLDIPDRQFSKPYIRTDFRIGKENKMPFGLVHIRYSDKKLHRQIMNDIDIICSDLLKN